MGLGGNAFSPRLPSLGDKIWSGASRSLLLAARTVESSHVAESAIQRVLGKPPCMSTFRSGPRLEHGPRLRKNYGRFPVRCRDTYCVHPTMAALANKVALITGAAQGIGLAATRLMLQHGAKVSGPQHHPRVDPGNDCSRW